MPEGSPEEDRLRAENEQLKALIQRFLAFRPHGNFPARTEEAWVNLKAHTIKALKKIAENKPVRVKEDPVERTAFFARNVYARFFEDYPVIVLERLKKRTWEAFIDKHDEDIGVASGETALQAIRDLHGRLKNFATREGPSESDRSRFSRYRKGK